MQQDTWRSTCQNTLIPSETANTWLQQLMIRYSESHRYYHNWNFMLKQKVPFLGNNVPAHIAFAVFFQYYFFDIKHDCCDKNCDAFKKFYTESGIDNSDLLNAVLHLLGNIYSNYEGIEEDMRYFQDMDLIILGGSPDEYKNYTESLLKEYSHMDALSYKAMRLKILQTFLTIPNIYSTDLFREKFEDRARANINNEIIELKK